MQEPNLTYGLPPTQEKVIAAIAGGATLQAAAEAAGIHRNTITYWSRTSPRFQDALTQAQYEKAITIREQAETHLADAFEAIHNILTNPDASDSARLNAAKYIIEKASTPPPPQPEVCAQPEIVHSPAQSAPPQTVRANPKIGRNEQCPCGSNLKFKRCCLNRPQVQTAAA